MGYGFQSCPVLLLDLLNTKFPEKIAGGYQRNAKDCDADLSIGQARYLHSHSAVEMVTVGTGCIGRPRAANQRRSFTPQTKTLPMRTSYCQNERFRRNDLQTQLNFAEWGLRA